jgi:hypothetical protein
MMRWKRIPIWVLLTIAITVSSAAAVDVGALVDTIIKGAAPADRVVQ